MAPYRAGIEEFFGNNTPTGSDPSVPADVIHQAAVDTDPVKVHHHSDPDSMAIPRAKQILGQEGLLAGVP
ncbi:hypothetical protein ACH46L_25040 [Streptomyces althioticus]|uniref:hypothetical protein n=1 Tax=Streptomyces althioticus TaxID=83380 RepID=UPI0037904B25